MHNYKAYDGHSYVKKNYKISIWFPLSSLLDKALSASVSVLQIYGK